jgi:hypothetical protein
MTQTRVRLRLPLPDEIWKFLEQRVVPLFNLRLATQGKPPVSTAAVIGAILTAEVIRNREEIIEEYEKVISRATKLEFDRSVDPHLVQALGSHLPAGMSLTHRGTKPRKLPAETLPLNCLVPSRGMRTK